MAVFVQLLITGLAMGSIYALVALGVVLVYNSIRSLNFAQGDFLMLGAYVALTGSSFLKLPYSITFLMVLLISGAVGVGFERLVSHPLLVRRSHPTSILVASIGASVCIRNVAMLIWGPLPMPYDQPFGNAVLRFGVYSIPLKYLLIIGVTVVLVILMFLFLERSRFGRMVRASSEDPETAALMGVRVATMTILTFALAGALAGVGGLLLAPVFFATTEMGYLVGMKAFASSIVGGFGTIPGAIVGGLLLGLIEVLCAGYISSTYKDVFVFIVLVLVLQMRPQGLMGRAVAEKL